MTFQLSNSMVFPPLLDLSASQAHTVVDTDPSNGQDTSAANGEERQPDGIGFVASRLGRPLLMDGATASKKRIAYARVCIEVEFSSELPKCFEVEMEKVDIRKIKMEYSWIPKLCGNCTNFGHFSDNCHWTQEEAMNDTNATNQGVGRNRRRNKRVWTQKQVTVEQDMAPIPDSSCARNENKVLVHEPGSESQSDILINTTETTLVILADDPSLTRLGSTHNSVAVVEENNIELTVLMDAITENLMAPGLPEHNKEVLPMAIELDDEGLDYDLLEMATPNPYSALSLCQEDMERFNEDEGLDILGMKDDDISVEKTEYFCEHLVPIDNRELQLVVAEVTPLASRTGTYDWEYPVALEAFTKDMLKKLKDNQPETLIPLRTSLLMLLK
ncbi:hypothetical protein IFM89_035349 [Coptis chinensis]|uniref:Zinc knuckle CX2CX4HX4C domain-containing protein n=1 Tax=Coptis chinensis TaxID=261450 RepID=A0A835H2K0_9MAGN|nr:hypothetical protein IFM89_035349 [Coptis chinensis]